VSEVNIYLFLYPKEAFHILKKTKRKKKASAKQKKSRTKKIRSVVVRFYQACELIRFYHDWNWSDLACPFCPILPSLQTYPILPGLKTGPFCPILLRLRTCPFLPGLKTGPILLVCFARFYQGCELVRFFQGWKLVRSCLSVLPDFTKADNLSVFTRATNLSVFPRTENLSNSSSCLSS
jgi:hypothetical protein